MIEKTIITKKSDKNKLREMKKRLLNEIRESGGIMTEMEEGGSYCLLIAYQDKKVYEDIIKEELIKYYSYYKKIEFFRNGLKLDNVKPILAEAFSRALGRYDQRLDIKEVNRQLYNFDTLNLDSFFFFRLKKMRERWAELVELTNENAIWMLSNQSFEDLLKFLISSLEPLIKQIYVEICDNECYIYDFDKNLITRKKIKPKNAHYWLIMSFIKYSPQKITIKDNKGKTSFREINKLFGKKVVYSLCEN